MNSAIVFKNVTKVYHGQIFGLKDINLEVEKGDFVFIIGHSGAGKSTLLKLLYRALLPSSGEVYVNNMNLMKLKNKDIPVFRRTLGVVFQDVKLLPRKTAIENISLCLEMLGLSDREVKKRAYKSLELVKLSGKSRAFPNELSGGEQQRLAIARAISYYPTLLIADEPTGNIDLKTSWEIMSIFENLNRMGMTILITTHNPIIVSKMNKRVIQLKNGQVESDSLEPTPIVYEQI